MTPEKKGSSFLVGQVATTLEEVEAQERAIDAWAKELDAAAWDAYLAAEDRLEVERSA